VPDTLDLQDDLRYQEVPMKILDTITRRTCTSSVTLCCVQWSGHTESEATWEREDALRTKFPHLFKDQPNLRDEIPSKWGRFVTSHFSHQYKTSISTINNLISSKLTSRIN
jgi:hypothetical protein